MEAAEVKEFIKRFHGLSTIPVLLGKILSIVRDDNSPADELFRLISHDPALAERIIRVANSASFGHSGQIKEIEQSILFLGYDKIRSIVVGMTVMDIFPARISFNIKNLWAHSCEVAFIASVLSEVTPMTSPKECFLSGLLHDIGRIIFYKMDHRRFYEIKTTEDMLEQELRLFGCTHGDAGSWFAEEIGMPDEIVSTTRFHHNPSSALEYKDAVSIIALAEALSRMLSPRIEEDGIWTSEHDSLMLEYSLTDETRIHIGARFFGAKKEIEGFFQ